MSPSVSPWLASSTPLPHHRRHLARAVPQDQREVRLAAPSLTDLNLLGQEERCEGLALDQVNDENLIHGVLTSRRSGVPKRRGIGRIAGAPPRRTSALRLDEGDEANGRNNVLHELPPLLAALEQLLIAHGDIHGDD
jgi:hypothetical protein